MLSGTIGASGTVNAILPSAAVSGGGLPAIACYVSSNGSSWLAVAQVPSTPTQTYCGLTGIGTSSAAITLINGVPGWFFYLVAVY